MISIILPVYNSERFLEETIVSVLKQDFLNFELIIINDFSNDKSYQIINHYLKLDKRIKLFNNTSNMGVSYSRNRGIKESKHNILTFIDSDDIWSVDKLSNQYKFFIKERLNFCSTNFYFIDDKSKILNKSLKLPYNINYRKLIFWNSIITSSVMVHKSLLNDTFSKDGNFHEDYLFWITLSKKKEFHGKIFQNRLVYYRLYRNSRSGNKLKTIKKLLIVYKLSGINFLLWPFLLFSHLGHSLIKYIGINF